MSRTSLVFVICAGALFVALPASAKEKHRKTIKSPKASAEITPPRAPSKGDVAGQGWIRADWRFSDQERAQIQRYVQNFGANKQNKPKGLPPGLAKKVARGESLPPGWQRKCQIGAPMPPAVYEHCRPLPPELVLQLPRAPEPTITVAIGGKVVRLLQATREILDVFDIHVRL